ncbi:hypothetical protein [Mycobacterium paraintracellulare]|uniref:hypothetical protein n=1 Tax=Mycobacterium paraintracellulare TaxID=1138383 RepID=UPI0019164ED5|nr:hypothetical protein [Mycobacterium paraintracellulare]
MTHALDHPDVYTALTHALQHLRHALRCTGRAMSDLDDGTPAVLRGAELCADINAAARNCATLLDHLDGYRCATVLDDGRRQAVDAAKQRHRVGNAL